MNYDKYFNYEDNSTTYCLTSELISLYIKKLNEKFEDNIIIVTSSLFEANKIYNSLINHYNEVYLFPMDDYVSSLILAESPEFKLDRLNVLDKINTVSSNKKKIVITNLLGYLKPLPNKDNSKNLDIFGDLSIKRDDFTKELFKLGYHRESMVTTTGEFSVRGFIIDIFPINEEHPVRIELSFDNVESIKYFSEDTQRTLQQIDNITIKPISEIITGKGSNLLDYLLNPTVVFYNFDQIQINYLNVLKDIGEYNDRNLNLYSFEDLIPKKTLYLDTINNFSNALVEEMQNFKEDFKLLKEKVEKWQFDNKKVYFCIDKLNQKKEILEVIPDAKFKNLKINKGFIVDDEVYICENDIGTVSNSEIKYQATLRMGKRIKNYNDLEKGDYVVHVNHGIGVYEGISCLKQNNLQKDYLMIRYQDGDKIYVPVEKITLLYKYSGKESEVKLNSLNGDTWKKTKAYVKKKAKDISQELLILYKKRANIKGEPFKDYAEESIFANNFIYDETRDQLKAISEIDEDLKKDIPMDRLLCGDVGFGKTEVAMRGIFKTVINNKQVMYLCPTTILAKQQYNVIKKRFEDEAIEVKLLNRFTSSKEAKNILDGVSKGTVDILVGTHRILSNDVKPPKLGLIVIDEEQRFGVKHKEKIKEYKTDVNVLTLSATPIPRTLKMALSGLRDLSIIDTPPVNRYPVQTYVMKEDELLVKDAIYKELSRNGQIFILYNSVEKLNDISDKIKKLVPEARVSFAHGKMSKEEIEDIMDNFVSKKFDILICTTIVENGIDIPNANTLIVYDSDKFGLSQLYQIRGRVGRSNKIAYAYLLYNPQKILNDTAQKRLQAIKEFASLGSGYKIAMRDLSIRGAGDIFGSDQAGFVDTVGVNFYMKLIEDEFKSLKGEKIIEEKETKSLLNVSTHIDDEYVTDEDIKIEIHQKINEINSFDKLEAVRQELEDRFGKIDINMEIYMYEELFSNMADELNITNVKTTNKYIEIELPEKLSNTIKGEKLLLEVMNISTKFNLKYLHQNIIITLYYENLEQHYIFYLVRLLTVIKEN